ncbi:MAG: hypothetical protein ACRYFX_14360 [Janthinobacterium lividum]
MPLTFTQESDFRQERDFGQKISATFEFLGAHWRPLGRVLLYLVLPIALLQGVIGALLQSELLSSVMRYPGAVYPGRLGMYSSMYGQMLSSPYYYINLIVSFAFNSVLILTIYGYLLHCLYPPVPGAPVLPSQVWGVVRSRFVGTFFSLIGLAIVLGLSSFLFVIPGIYLAVALSLFFIVRMVENTSFGTTFSRCLSLTKGKWWSTAGLIFIIILILYLLIAGFTIFWSLLLSTTRGLLPAMGDNFLFLRVLVAAVTPLATLLVYLPMLVALAFQYFNLVERKEGVGMHHLVDQLGQAAPAGPANDAYRPVEEGEY